ncbi:radical SAM protein [Thermodesulfobacteriota bacterium]
MEPLFEQGPIRPPSEAASLLIRATRNCPWNRCAFCPVYKGTKFEIRPVEEVEADIDAVASIVEAVRETSRCLSHEGRVDSAVIESIFRDPTTSDQTRSVAAWLYNGARTVFLQDANSLVMKTADLVRILTKLKETFPHIDRITSYARSKTVAKKSLEELRDLAAAGLTRIHIGLESAFDPLLEFMKKGTTAADHVEAGRKVMASGISLSEYVILGLGGKRWWREHATATAMALNEINPGYIRVRTLAVPPGTALHDRIEAGEFEILSEEQVIVEERLLVESLNGIRSRFVSDHVLNLLEEAQGRFPEDKERLLAVIDRFLALPSAERLNFRLGRRMGAYRALDDLEDPLRHAQVEEAIEQISQNSPEGIGETINALLQRFI